MVFGQLVEDSLGGACADTKLMRAILPGCARRSQAGNLGGVDSSA